MFHQFFPLIPFTLAGALFFKRKSLAYGFPIILVAIRAALSQFSWIWFFLAGALLLSVFLTRKLKLSWGLSWKAVFGYAALSVVIFELIANLGVWILQGGCATGETLYSQTFKGLLDCYLAAWRYSLAHFLRDVPITLILVKAIEWVLARKAQTTIIEGWQNHRS